MSADGRNGQDGKCPKCGRKMVMISMTTQEGKRLDGRACTRCHTATTEDLRKALAVGDEV